MTKLTPSQLKRTISGLQSADRDLTEVRLQIAQAEREHAKKIADLRRRENHYASQVSTAVDILAAHVE